MLGGSAAALANFVPAPVAAGFGLVAGMATFTGAVVWERRARASDFDRRRADRKNGEAASPSLVVVPKSIVFNWMREAQAFTPQLVVQRRVEADEPSVVRLHDQQARRGARHDAVQGHGNALRQIRLVPELVDDLRDHRQPENQLTPNGGQRPCQWDNARQPGQTVFSMDQ